jgi:peptide/nickel transport system permease protein
MGRLSARYVLRKVVVSFGTLVFVVLFNFFLFRVLPGDPAKAFAPRGRTTNLQEIRHRMGTDLPMWRQFVKYLNDLIHLNLGESWSRHRPVWELITERLWPTLLLSGTALFLSAGLGVWFGAKAGWRNGSRFDKTTSSFAVTMYSVPEWWLGLLLLLALGSSRGLNLFPVSGMSDSQSSLPHWLDIAYHLVLPVTSLAVLYIAEYSLIMRSSVLDERYTDYLNTARAKGLRDDQVLNRHALPNALLPSITLFFLSLGWVVGGTITVEKIFTWPGLGLLTAEALKGPDIPLLQGAFVIFSAAVIVMNLLADLIYPLIDPRVKEV